MTGPYRNEIIWKYINHYGYFIFFPIKNIYSLYSLGNETANMNIFFLTLFGRVNFSHVNFSPVTLIIKSDTIIERFHEELRNSSLSVSEKL